MDYPKLEEIDHMLTEYGKLGVKLMITELDINVLPNPTGNTGADITRREARREAIDPYPDGLPPEIAARSWPSGTPRSFQCSTKHRDKIDRVTFWGVHDGQSWLNYWPMQRTNYPLLFDRQLQPKPAFDAVIRAAK